MGRKGLNRDKIIEVAVQLVETKGFNNLSLTDLAETLKIKPASVYNHFNNIEEIVVGVGIFAVNELKKCLSEAIKGQHRVAALLALTEAYRKFGQEHPELYKAFIALHVVEEPSAVAPIRAVVELIFTVLREFALTDIQRIHWERILRSTMHGFTAYEEAGWFVRRPAPLDDSYHLAIKNILVSIEAMERINALGK